MSRLLASTSTTSSALWAFNELIDQGHSIIVIEHNLEVVKCADHVIDLGPEGGDKGGEIVATGTPAEIAAVERSYTGVYLRPYLNRNVSPFAPVLQKPAPLPSVNDGIDDHSITIVGAKEHNLKNISVNIPRDRFIVFTGLSGSGKSSLAFDIVYAEGQRRYIDSLSAYARQFLEVMAPPTLTMSRASADGRYRAAPEPRRQESTVATVTEIYPSCACSTRKSASSIASTAASRFSLTRNQILDRIGRAYHGKDVMVLKPAARPQRLS
jgi:excinuclease ABC subunit A